MDGSRFQAMSTLTVTDQTISPLVSRWEAREMPGGAKDRKMAKQEGAQFIFPGDEFNRLCQEAEFVKFALRAKEEVPGN